MNKKSSMGKGMKKNDSKVNANKTEGTSRTRVRINL